MAIKTDLLREVVKADPDFYGGSTDQGASQLAFTRSSYGIPIAAMKTDLLRETVRADQDFYRERGRPSEYEFSNGRRFVANYASRGSYEEPDGIYTTTETITADYVE